MRNLSIIIISFFSIFLMQCGSTYHNSYIEYSSKFKSDCLKVKIKVDNPTIRWKRNGGRENVNIQATFYNNCSEDILIHNPFDYGKDGKFSVIDSSEKELERNWIDNFNTNKKYSILRYNDSLTISIIFPILYDYSLQYYGKYKIYLKYWGYFVKKYTQFEDRRDSVVISDTYKPWQDSVVISDTVEVQYIK